MPIKARNFLVSTALIISVISICITELSLTMFLTGEFAKYPNATRNCLTQIRIEENFLLFQSCFSTTDDNNQIHNWYAGKGWAMAIAVNESVLYGSSEIGSYGFYGLQHMEAVRNPKKQQTDIVITVRFLLIPTWWPYGVPEPLRTGQ
jgi:hypothetical protein